MSGHGEKLSRKREMAILALLTAPTVTAAAVQVGVGVATLMRWLREPEFAQAYHEAQCEVTAQAMAQLSRTCTDAVATLQNVMGDIGAPAAARVTAARAVLDFALRAVVIEDIATRLVEVETQIGSAR